MGIICKLFGHKWNGCKCERCGDTRNEGQDFSFLEDKGIEKSSICGEERNMENPTGLVKRLVHHVTEKKIKVTLQISNKPIHYHVLSIQEADEATEKAKNYIKKFKIDNCEINSIYAFAQIIWNGDDFYYLFTDNSGKIYNYNSDNGWDPNAEIISDNLENIIGKVDFNTLNNDYHFNYIHPIVRLKDVVNIDRVEFIDPQGFLIENYKDLLLGLINANKLKLELKKFDYDEIEWDDDSQKEYSVNVCLNDIEGVVKIFKSKWFDESFPKQINDILDKIQDVDATLNIVQEEDNIFNQDFGLIFLNKEEYDFFKKNRLLV